MVRKPSRLPTVYECYGVAPIPKDWLPNEHQLVGVPGVDIGLYGTYDAAQFAADNLNEKAEKTKYGVFVVHVDIIQAVDRKDDSDGIEGYPRSKSPEGQESFDLGAEDSDR